MSLSRPSSRYPNFSTPTTTPITTPVPERYSKPLPLPNQLAPQPPPKQQGGGANVQDWRRQLQSGQPPYGGSGDAGNYPPQTYSPQPQGRDPQSYARQEVTTMPVPERYRNPLPPPRESAGQPAPKQQGEAKVEAWRRQVPSRPPKYSSKEQPRNYSSQQTYPQQLQGSGPQSYAQQEGPNLKTGNTALENHDQMTLEQKTNFHNFRKGQTVSQGSHDGPHGRAHITMHLSHDAVVDYAIKAQRDGKDSDLHGLMDHLEANNQLFGSYSVNAQQHEIPHGLDYSKCYLLNHHIDATLAQAKEMLGIRSMSSGRVRDTYSAATPEMQQIYEVRRQQQINNGAVDFNPRKNFSRSDGSANSDASSSRRSSNFSSLSIPSPSGTAASSISNASAKSRNSLTSFFRTIKNEVKIAVKESNDKAAERKIKAKEIEHNKNEYSEEETDLLSTRSITNRKEALQVIRELKTLRMRPSRTVFASEETDTMHGHYPTGLIGRSTELEVNKNKLAEYIATTHPNDQNTKDCFIKTGMGTEKAYNANPSPIAREIKKELATLRGELLQDHGINFDKIQAVLYPR